MNLPREDADRLRELLDNSPSMTKEKFIEAYAKFYQPDIPRLVEQDINRRATAFIARQKGSDGLRKAFVVGDKKAPIVVNIEIAEKLAEADAVVDHLTVGIRSRVPALRKARSKRAEILG